MKAYKALRTIEFTDGTKHVAGQIYSSSELTQPYFDVNKANYEEVGDLFFLKDLVPGIFFKIAGRESKDDCKFLYVGKDYKNNHICMYRNAIGDSANLTFWTHEIHNGDLLINTFVAQNWED